MTKFQIGDKVKFLNSIGGGVVTKITPDFVFVRDDTGFDMPMPPSELIRMADMSGVAAWITSHFWAFLVAFAVILVPATIGYFHTPVYYDFTQILSGDDVESMDAEDMQFLTAKQKLEEHFDVATTHMILCDADLPAKDAEAMARRIEKLDGVTTVLSLDSLLGTDIPADFLPGSVTKMLKSGQWQLMLINSAYAVSTDEVNGQIDATTPSTAS